MFEGADVEGLRGVGAQCEQGGDTADQVVMFLQALVIALKAASWFTGGASAAYAAYLESVVIPWLKKVSMALHLFAKVLGAHADAQEQASAGESVDWNSLPTYQTPQLPTGDCRAYPVMPVNPNGQTQVPSADTGAGSVPSATNPAGTLPNGMVFDNCFGTGNSSLPAAGSFGGAGASGGWDGAGTTATPGSVGGSGSLGPAGGTSAGGGASSGAAGGTSTGYDPAGSGAGVSGVDGLGSSGGGSSGGGAGSYGSDQGSIGTSPLGSLGSSDGNNNAAYAGAGAAAALGLGGVGAAAGLRGQGGQAGQGTGYTSGDGFDYNRIRGVQNNPNVTPEFLRKVEGIAGRLGTKPEYLMAAMSFESGETFSSSVKNPHSSATGLIQFMSKTAHGLGTSTADLRQMTPVQQLDYVEKYFQPYRGKVGTLEGVYTAILSGRAQPDPNAVLFSSGTDAYHDNRGLDANHDGRITTAEAAAKVRAKIRN